ncbi:putative phage abortive infection protein [Neobacillus niacini]|uniref:putative phage abortive infection protein n=1 Tax=Neobacillus niacini TaxID=86668 RepID=UPI0005EFB58E|nr:putative phage abortive infection protein [Neobacillus niacini]
MFRDLLNYWKGKWKEILFFFSILFILLYENLLKNIGPWWTNADVYGYITSLLAYGYIVIYFIYYLRVQRSLMEKEKSKENKSKNLSLVDDTEEKILENKAKTYSKFAWFVASITVLFPICGVLLVGLFNVNFGDLGPYGDFVAGSTVPFLTFSSFVLLSATLITQQVQLKVQMKELKLSREEFEKTNKELDEQNRTLVLQRFENTFFNILSSHNEVMDSIRPKFKEIYEKFKSKSEVERELKFFNDNNSFLYEDVLLKWFKFDPNDFKGILSGERVNENASKSLAYCRENIDLVHEFFVKVYQTREFKYILINQVYEEIYNEYHHILGHFFRSMHRIVKYVDNSNIINNEEKKFYLGIVRSQITSYEHIMLFYNCLSPYGNDGFLPLVKRYDFLDEMKDELLINKDICSHMELFTDFDDLDVDIIFNMSKVYQLGFHKKWLDNIKILKNYKSLFEFRIKEIANNYVNRQLVVPRELIKSIEKELIDKGLAKKIDSFINKLKIYESDKRELIKQLDIDIDYLEIINNECRVLKDECFEIFYNAQRSMVTN